MGRQGNYGTSGLSGISAEHKELPELPEHDETLVTVIDQNRRRWDQKLTIVAPHVGKAYCFDDFERSLRSMPVDEAHIWLYDNSPVGDFSEKLRRLAESLPSFTLIRDLNKPLSIENASDPVLLAARCSQVYSGLYDRVLQASPGQLILNLEDDIGATGRDFEFLTRALDSYPQLGAVISDCRCRRTKMICGIEDSPIACNFKETRRIGGNHEVEIEEERVRPQPAGVQCIGGGHHGFWLARREAVEAVGMKDDPQLNIVGHDYQFGYRLQRDTEFLFGIEWSSRVRHFLLENGQKTSI